MRVSQLTGARQGDKKMEVRFLQEHSHHPRVSFLDLAVPDPGGGLKCQREATSQGSSSAKNTMDLPR